MDCQLIRIQVGKDFPQNPGETDAQSVTHWERVKPTLLILEGRAGGLPMGPFKRLVNAQVLVRSQYSLALGTLTSTLHLLQSVVHPVLTSKVGLCYC